MVDCAAARAEETESLEAIYGPDFEVLDEQEWRVRLGDGRAWLTVLLTPEYPEVAPAPSIHAAGDKALPAKFSSEVCEQILSEFIPGDGCLVAWCGVVEERLRDLNFDDLPPVDDEKKTQGECSVVIDSSMAGKISPSLLDAGFKGYPNGLYSHLKDGITVSLGDKLSVSVDGIESDDLTDWLELQLLEDLDKFGAKLLDWATACRSEEPGFAQGAEEVEVGDYVEYLPTVEHNSGRDLTIITWGKAFRKVAPPESQANFNACILNGRGGGADLRVDNGLTEQVQKNVASCGLFPRWLEMCIHKIESEGLSIVSINCTKGRHRSVAAAEILKKVYYPAATMMHISPAIKK